MVVNEGAITLKGVFLRYLLTLCLAFAITLMLFIGAVALSFGAHLLYPANYTETLAREASSTLASAPAITEEMIPVGSRYAQFDKDGQLMKSNLTPSDLHEAKEAAQGRLQSSGGMKNYVVIQRQDGVCVLQYFIGMRYGSDFLQSHFPGVQTLLVAMFILLFIIAVLITSTLYAKRLSKRLDFLLSATTSIRDKNLDFEVTYSGIKEFDDVILSLSEMKSELKDSLERQWNLEQARKEQISALAHDLKTPLTIIKGNAELVQDSILDQEQQEYVDYILKNATQIEEYIKALIQISNSEQSPAPQREDINLRDFVEAIRKQLEALANPKGLQVAFIQKRIPEQAFLDSALLHRAIMNVIANAVDHSPRNGELSFEIRAEAGRLRFITTDSGSGFLPADIHSAAKQFYRGDSSRTDRSHYGLGLYITDSIVKLHGGSLCLANSPVTGGAQVTIDIPVK